MDSNAPPVLDHHCVERLKKRRDFLACRRGRRGHGAGFTLQLLKRPVLEGQAAKPAFRVGYTVTKKVGNAVLRNRIRRRLREAVRMSDFPSAVQGYDAVLMAKEEAATQNFLALQKDLERAVRAALKPRAAKRKDQATQQ